jgi:hypothetical protein
MEGMNEEVTDTKSNGVGTESDGNIYYVLCSLLTVDGHTRADLIGIPAKSIILSR